MKKTLAAVAVLGAFAGSALAADVQLYGIVDEGLAYSHVDLDGAADATDSFSMNSGMQSGSRFGFKGTEDLGNGLTVGFVLENGFSAPALTTTRSLIVKLLSSFRAASVNWPSARSVRSTAVPAPGLRLAFSLPSALPTGAATPTKLAALLPPAL